MTMGNMELRDSFRVLLEGSEDEQSVALKKLLCEARFSRSLLIGGQKRSLGDALHSWMEVTRWIGRGVSDAALVRGIYGFYESTSPHGRHAQSGTIHLSSWTDSVRGHALVSAAPVVGDSRWLARWLLTEWKVSWLTGEYVSECLEALGVDPWFEWLSFAWDRSGVSLGVEDQRRSLEFWRLGSLTARGRGVMSVGLMGVMESGDVSVALEAIGALGEEKPYILARWIEVAEGLGRGDLVSMGTEALCLHAVGGSGLAARLLVKFHRVAQKELESLCSRVTTETLYGWGILAELRRLGYFGG